MVFLLFLLRICSDFDSICNCVDSFLFSVWNPFFSLFRPSGSYILFVSFTPFFLHSLQFRRWWWYRINWLVRPLDKTLLSSAPQRLFQSQLTFGCELHRKMTQSLLPVSFKHSFHIFVFAFVPKPNWLPFMLRLLFSAYPFNPNRFEFQPNFFFYLLYFDWSIWPRWDYTEKWAIEKLTFPMRWNSIQAKESAWIETSNESKPNFNPFFPVELRYAITRKTFSTMETKQLNCINNVNYSEIYSKTLTHIL